MHVQKLYTVTHRFLLRMEIAKRDCENKAKARERETTFELLDSTVNV